MRRAPPRPARTPRRDARSRGTCRGSRRPATAARCRRRAPRAAAARTASGRRRRALERAHPAQRVLERGGIAADEHRVAHLAAKARGQRREVLILAVAAQRSSPAVPPCRRRRPASPRRWCPWSHRRSARRATSATHCERCGRPAKLRSSSSIAAQRQRQRLAERQRRERVGRVVQPLDLHAPSGPAAAHRRASATSAPSCSATA